MSKDLSKALSNAEFAVLKAQTELKHANTSQDQERIRIANLALKKAKRTLTAAKTAKVKEDQVLNRRRK